jgi:exonuclease III
MIRIATWNVAGTGKSAWAYVVSALPADIILLQECRDPAVYLPADVYGHNSPCIRWEPNSDNRGKGIAIYTRGFLLASVPFQHHPGWAQVADVTMSEGNVIRLINVHGEVKKHYYVTDTLHAIVNDLLPLMSRNHCLLLGGDLNVSLLYGERTRNPRHHAFLERLTHECALVNCTARYFAMEPRTIRGRGQRQIAPYQDDYLFASPPLASRLAGVEVLDTPEVQKVSDHNPVIATFKEGKELESVSHE